jgi:FlaA1/EpsC-like NDP-sugar epimerase
MSDKENIFLFGASGHAKVVADIVEREGRYAIAFLADDAESLTGSEMFGYPVIGGRANRQLHMVDGQFTDKTGRAP